MGIARFENVVINNLTNVLVRLVSRQLQLQNGLHHVLLLKMCVTIYLYPKGIEFTVVW